MSLRGSIRYIQRQVHAVQTEGGMILESIVDAVHVTSRTQDQVHACNCCYIAS